MDEVVKEPAAECSGSIWTELLVVLACTALPNAAQGLLYLGSHSESTASFVSMALSHCFQSVGWIVPVMYFILRSPAGMGGFGILDIRWGHDAGLALVLTALCLGTAFLFYAMWSAAGLPTWTTTRDVGPRNAYDWSIYLVMLLANSIAEELLVRSYLITRLELLLESTGLAVVVAAMIFAGYHFYQGLLGAHGALVFGLIMGIGYCKLRRIWPLVLAHTFYNIIAAL